jgi:hypothetical protein
MTTIKNLFLTLGLIFSTQAMAHEPLLSGEFFTVTQGDDVEGSVKIVENERKERFVVLGADFMSARGPDLFVILHEQVIPTSYARGNFVNLGELKKFKGKQYYKIPANVNLDDFKAVVIWCQKFDVTFGSAELK